MGLNIESFIARQNTLSPGLVTQLSTELIGYETAPVASIVAGIDDAGPHIYSVDNGALTCQDAVGFAAIGMGSYHASSSFMFSRHVKSNVLSKTLFLTYTAKKRAEVAPGVGGETDMFIVGPRFGSYSTIRSDIIDNLEEIYQLARKSHAEADSVAEGAAHEYIEQIVRPQPEPIQEVQQITRRETSASGEESAEANPS